MTTMTYDGYIATIELDEDAGLFYGEVINTRDVLTFLGRTIDELQYSLRRYDRRLYRMVPRAWKRMRSGHIRATSPSGCRPIYIAGSRPPLVASEKVLMRSSAETLERSA